MEYWSQEGRRISSDLALRVGMLVQQYDNLTGKTPEGEQFECTLYLMALTTLLNQCAELTYDMTSELKKNGYEGREYDLNADVYKCSGLWGGITKKSINEDFGYKELKYSKLLRHMRNALAHPQDASGNSKYPQTGYTEIKDDSGKVNSFLLVTSPYTYKNGQLKSYDKKEQADKIIKDFFPPRNDISSKKETNGKYRLYKGDELFVPSFQVTISVQIMRELVIKLSNYLGQPAQKHWDGVTIDELIRKE